MQTFLPHSDFAKTASVLDDKRLGKQRVEAFQILKSIETRNAWYKHPAVKMWIGYEGALCQYFNCIAEEWIRRGFRHNMGFYLKKPTMLPWWMGMENFHSAHRAALLVKNPEWYGQFEWKETPTIQYYWPAMPNSVIGNTAAFEAVFPGSSPGLAAKEK